MITARAHRPRHSDAGRVTAAPKGLASSSAPPPPAGAGAVSPLHARLEGPPPAFPPRGRAGPATPAHYPFAPPQRIWAHAATRDRCQCPRWRLRPGPAGTRLSPSPVMRPLSAQACALDRWAGTGLEVGQAKAKAHVFSHFPRRAPSQRRSTQRLAPAASFGRPAPLGLAASAANGVQDVCGKAGRGGASLLFVGRLAWPLASAGRGAGTDGAVLWLPADQ